MGVSSWRRPEPTLAAATGGSLAEELGWSDAQEADHLVIGYCPEGADYSNPLLLRLSTGEVWGVTENIPVARCLGQLEEWVAEARPEGCGDMKRVYLQDDADTPAAVAASHRFYLKFAPQGLDPTARAARWGDVEAAFVAALSEA
jgi:hypothetical protein